MDIPMSDRPKQIVGEVAREILERIMNSPRNASQSATGRS